MKIRKMSHILCATSLVAFASLASAQSTETAQAPATEATPAAVAETGAPVEAPPQDIVLKKGTPITLAVAEEVNSSTHDGGDTFKLTVLNDVTAGGKVVIPRGTPATAEVTWRTGKGAFGKSGKMEFGLRSIDLNGQPIPVSGQFRQEGEGNTVATGVGVIAIGVFAGFITGKRARLPVGRELMSQLAQDVTFTPDGQLSAAFDAKAALAAAELETPLGKCKAAAKQLTKVKAQEKALEDCYAERME